jgi:CubicO group peptidase (beta-lactamase class C family)
VFGQGEKALTSKLEQRLHFLKDSLDIPGLSVSVILDDQIVLKQSLGYSNLEHGTPMTDTSLFRVWSVSKQFCAVSILRLWEEGRLKLDDPISKYLDSIPVQWKDVRISHLLNQTGGIKDYLNDYPEGRKLTATPYEEVRDSVAELKFEPGKGWSYTNTGYWVLTKVVESVVNMDYQDYLKETFFRPSGMLLTQKMDYYTVIPGRVSGYRVSKGIPYNSTRKLDEGFEADGDAELLSNVDDLTRWTRDLTGGKYLSEKGLEKAWEATFLDNGDSIDASYLIYYDDRAGYGMGWFLSTLGEEKIAWTPGAGRGFSTCIMTVPDRDLSLVVLTNTRRFLIADKIAKDLAALVLDHRE